MKFDKNLFASDQFKKKDIQIQRQNRNSEMEMVSIKFHKFMNHKMNYFSYIRNFKQITIGFAVLNSYRIQKNCAFRVNKLCYMTRIKMSERFLSHE